MANPTGVPPDDAQFSLGNIPFGIASRHDSNVGAQACTRLRQHVYFLPELIASGLLPGLEQATVDALLQASFQPTRSAMSWSNCNSLD